MNVCQFGWCVQASMPQSIHRSLLIKAAKNIVITFILVAVYVLVLVKVNVVCVCVCVCRECVCCRCIYGMK